MTTYGSPFTGRVPSPAVGAGTELGVAAAVDDVGPGEVPQRCGEHVYQAGERPEREQYPGGQRMQPEPDRRLQDQVGAWMRVEMDRNHGATV